MGPVERHESPAYSAVRDSCGTRIGTLNPPPMTCPYALEAASVAGLRPEPSTVQEAPERARVLPPSTEPGCWSVGVYLGAAKALCAGGRGEDSAQGRDLYSHEVARRPRLGRSRRNGNPSAVQVSAAGEERRTARSAARSCSGENPTPWPREPLDGDDLGPLTLRDTVLSDERKFSSFVIGFCGPRRGVACPTSSRQDSAA